MTIEGAFGHRLGDRFHLRQAPTFVTKALGKFDVAATLIKCDIAHNGLTKPIPCEEALLVALQLKTCLRHDLSIDGKWVKTAPLEAGTTCIYDLQSNPIANSISPFMSLHFYLPRKALDAISEAEECSYVQAIEHNPGVGVNDAVVRELGYALMPSFGDAAVDNSLVDYLTVSVASHIVVRYGNMRKDRPVGKLDAASEARAKEMLNASIDGIPLVTLAREFGMSARTFCRAFRAATGMLPHDWLKKIKADAARTGH
ncbi:helix-turn-helix transcriptional regulator [Rhizobium tropici]|uniref:Helix-turn-helix transcriptional regulator n=1 Tax=Rhizobium tropici TaxID=398 RepID=A0A5B0VQ28_RHITR|nr:AraC family transcriptional regulator [Rhizobium tropici]KAA1176524.1 helix-turn-helix transcriptional regulator [Rhizobium tropici]